MASRSQPCKPPCSLGSLRAPCGRASVLVGALAIAAGLAATTEVRGQSRRSEREASLRLCKEKRPEGATQLQSAYQRSKDAEALFALALCQESLGQDRDAVESYRAYLRLPLALRIPEAKTHIASIEERASAPAQTTKMPEPPRYALLAQGRESDTCVARCTGPEPRSGLDSSQSNDRAPTDRAQRMLKQQSDLAGLNKGFTREFLCVANCPGARVSKGTCPDPQSLRTLRCVQDRTSHLAPGVLTPKTF
jgi:hypothetical protein